MIRENAFCKDECHRTFLFTSGHAHCIGPNKIFIFCCPPFFGGLMGCHKEPLNIIRLRSFETKEANTSPLQMRS